MKRAITQLLFLIWSASSALAAQIDVVDFGTGKSIVFTGEILSGDAVKFREVAYRRSSNIVILKSPGGSLNAGLEIAQAVRELGLTTAVPAKGGCYSACALIWVAGVQRYMSRSAQIGFHAAYYRENGVTRETGVGNARVGAFLTRIGLPESAVIYMTVAPPDDFAPLTPEVARKIGVDFAYFDPPLQTKPTEETASPTRSGGLHYVAGLNPRGDNWLALKTGPSIDASRIAKLPPNTFLKVVSKEGEWLRVELEDGRTGWVFSKFVKCCR